MGKQSMKHEPIAPTPIRHGELLRPFRRTLGSWCSDILLTAGFVAMTLVACRRHTTDNEPDPIPECEEYEKIFDSCMSQDAAIARTIAIQAQTEEDRAHTRELCRVNTLR